MQTLKKIFNKALLAMFWILLAITYNQLSYADSKEYLTKWYEYKLQTAKPEIIDNYTIDEIADDLANNKKPIYSLIVDSNSVSPSVDVLEKLLNALKTNTTIKDLSFFNFSGENIEKISKTLSSAVFDYRKDRGINWLISVNFTNNNDNTNVIEESAAKEIALLINRGLVSLNLSGNKIGTDDLAIIVRELPSKLINLYLNRTKISRGGIDVLANALRKGGDQLAFLSLNQNSIDSDSAIQIIDAITLGSYLKNISFAENNLGNDKKISQIVSGCISKGISNINLAKNYINSTDIIDLINTIYMYSDIKLNFAENKIDSRGALAIANSQAWQKFKMAVNLGGNNIGFYGAMALINTVNTKEKLEELNLGMTDIENPIPVTNEHSEL